MNTISPSSFSSPWDVITYALMAAYIFYAANRWNRKGFVDWTFRLGDRNIGPKVEEGRISRKKSRKAFWLIQVVASLAFAYCLTSAVFNESEKWMLIVSYLITSVILLFFLIYTANRIDRNNA